MGRFTLGISPSISLVAASALWAFATVISKQLLTVFPPITFLVLQLTPSVLACALYTVLTRAFTRDFDPLLAAALQQTTGLLWALAIWPLEPGSADRPLLLHQSEVMGAAVSGLMYYAAAFWLYINALQSVNASTAGVFINLTPVFGVATAHAVLGERLTLNQWIGAAVIIASVIAILTRGGPQPNHSMLA